MTIATLPPICCLSKPLDLSAEAFGTLRDSSDASADFPTLRRRMEQDGYLYLPGALHRDEVLEARREMTRRLAAEGQLARGTDPMDSIANPDANVGFRPDLARDNGPLRKVIYDGPMMEFFSAFLGGAVRHFDYTWIRAISPGHGSPPHCDIVYMGRGTTRLYTAWTPLGDVGLEVGGLIVLEGSHRHAKLRENYCTKDVDAWCTNRRESPPDGLGQGGNIGRGGWLSKNPVLLRERLGGRWLTAEYRAGDLLVFSMFTVHAAIDNRSNQIRLSSDTRYQLASEPVDERWIGENPIAHGREAKRGLVC